MTGECPTRILHHMVHYARAFGALGDPTRLAILDRLAASPASISSLAADNAMTLNGIRKHVKVLEDAGLVSTHKSGRVRTCRLRPGGLEKASTWMEQHLRMTEERFDRLDELLGQIGKEQA